MRASIRCRSGEPSVRTATSCRVVDLSGEPGVRTSPSPIWRRPSRSIDVDDGTWVERARSRTTGAPEPASPSTTGRCCTAAASRTPAPGAGSPAPFLELDGIFYYGDVWFDGEYLGATEGYFVPPRVRGHRTRCATATSTCSRSRSRARRNATAPRSARSPAATGSRRCSTPTLNPGGIWRPVRVVVDGPGAHRERARAVRRGVGRARPARVQRHARRRRRARASASARGRARPGRRRAARRVARPVTLAAGTNRAGVDARASTTAPRWWPRALGPQTLCTVRSRRRGRRRA